MRDRKLHTPVVFIIFNRPDLTEKVFQQIAKVRPQKLFVIADGARFPEEQEKCDRARNIIEQVDWNCEVITDFSDTNLGCKKRVSSGLDWVFSQVEEAIILEDDCLPAESFFYFCQELLKYYRDDKRIMHISGDNFQLGKSRTKYSYYFSKYMHCWGWASWRRAWKYFDINMTTWLEYKQSEIISSVCNNLEEQKYWINMFDRVFNNEINSWAYIWLYTCFSQSGLSIIPDRNLVSNIGFRKDGTHTFSEKDPKAELKTKDIWKIKHPLFIGQHRKADCYTFESVFNPEKNRQSLVVNFKRIMYFFC